MLDNIEDIIPAIDLLNELKPEDIPHQKIILSLNYLNKSNGNLMWHRMADVYYNLNNKISASNRSRIINSVVLIAVNLISPIHFGFSGYSSYYGYCPNKIIFTDYVKEFTSFYFGKTLIPVGLIYSESFPGGCYRHVFPADDLMYYKKLDFSWNFPIFIDEFSDYMDQFLQKTPKTATIIVRSEVLIPDRYIWEPNQYASGDRNYNIKPAAYATNQNQNTTKSFITKLYQNAECLFHHMILLWASLKNRNVILGNAMKNVTSELFSKSGTRSKNILPYINYPNAIGDFCEVEVKISQITARYEAVLLDEREQILPYIFFKC